jgi:hypothetical protein
MRHCPRTLAWLVVAMLAALPPLAGAALPDVTTVPGFWNNVDDDDVVTLGVSPSFATRTQDLGSLRRLAVGMPLILSEEQQRPPAVPRFRCSSRAPPIE